MWTLAELVLYAFAIPLLTFSWRAHGFYKALPVKTVEEFDEHLLDTLELTRDDPVRRCLRRHLPLPLVTLRRPLDQFAGVVVSRGGSGRKPILPAGKLSTGHRQRPGTANNVIFATLEDETGIANIIIWDRVFQKNRRAVLASRLLAVRGELQREGRVIHLVAQAFTDLTPHLTALANGHELGDAVLARADEGRSGPHDGRDVAELRRREAQERQARAAMPRGRNFH